MKTISLLTICAFITAGLLAYTFKHETKGPLSEACYISCFNADIIDQFKTASNSAAFANMHPEPIPFQLENPEGNMMKFTTPDGTQAGAYEIKAKKKTNNYLIVIQEWWGLNDYIKNESDKLYKELGNVNVLAVDMYDGKVATTRDSAMKYMQSQSKERMVNIVNGAINYTGKKAKIYTIGWCFGGMWSLQTAMLAGDKAKGCVMYYGRPETDVEKLKMLRCDVIGFFGTKDKSPTPEMVAQFEKDMATAGKSFSKNMYDAGHGFANPSNPNFNKEATEDAFQKTIAYLKNKMQ